MYVESTKSKTPRKLGPVGLEECKIIDILPLRCGGKASSFIITIVKTESSEKVHKTSSFVTAGIYKAFLNRRKPTRTVSLRVLTSQQNLESLANMDEMDDDDYDLIPATSVGIQTDKNPCKLNQTDIYYEG